MFTRQFHDRQAVVVELEQPDHVVSGGALVAHVAADELWLDTRHWPEAFRALDPGTKLRLRVSDRTGTWFADTTLASTELTPLSLRLVVRRPARPVTERRGWQREPVVLPASLKIHGYAMATVEGRTHEVGGNGFGMEVPLPLPAAMVVEATLTIPGAGQVHSRARIVRCVPVPDADAEPRYAVAVRFESIDGLQQQRLVAWLGEIERARRADPVTTG